MELVVLGIALAALAAVILTLVAPHVERNRLGRKDGTAGCADDGWTPGVFGDGGASECCFGDGGGDCGGGGGDGGGGD